MSQLLRNYTIVLAARDGRLFRARAWGAEATDGTPRWNGWLEFVPLDGGPAVTTGAETTQPGLAATIYWATGLRAVYLEGALGRALGDRPGRAVSFAAAHTPKSVARNTDNGPGGSRRSVSPRGAPTATAREWSHPLSAWDRWLLKSFGIGIE